MIHYIILMTIDICWILILSIQLFVSSGSEFQLGVLLAAIAIQLICLFKFKGTKEKDCVESGAENKC